MKKPAFFFVPLPFWKSSQELCRLFVSVSIFWKRILLLYDLASFFFFTRVFASSSGCISSHCTCAAVHSSSVHSDLPAKYTYQVAHLRFSQFIPDSEVKADESGIR